MSWLNLKYGFRQLRLNRGFALTAILSLTLGIGANAAVFQLLNAIRLRALPVRDPAGLVEVKIADGARNFGLHEDWYSITYPLWEQIQRNAEGFTGLFAWSMEQSPIGSGVVLRNVRSLLITAQAFDTLGLRSERGRLLAASDESNGCAGGAALISEGFWQTEFGGRESAVGSTILIHEKPFTIVGVTPGGFYGLEVGRSFDIALPLCSAALWDKDQLRQRDDFWIGLMGRLAPGWTSQQAAARLGVAGKSWFDAVAPSGYDVQDMENWKRLVLSVEPRPGGISLLREHYQTSLWLLLGITGLVLAIACANLANLLFARITAKKKEVAIRMAVGGSRGRIVSEFLAESVLLAIGGALSGGALAMFLSRALVAFISTTPGDPIHLALGADVRMIGFVAIVAVAVCLGFGLTTAIVATRVPAAANLGTRATPDRRRVSFQRLLIAAQIAISLVLIIGSMLFIRTFQNLYSLDAGFRQEGLTFAYVDWRTIHAAGDRLETLQKQLVESLRAQRGIQSATTSTHMPMDGAWALGVAVNKNDRGRPSWFTWVSPQFLATMQMRLLRGRDLSASDTAKSPHVALINESFARELFGSGDPIGRTFRSLTEPGYPSQQYEVAGVVNDTKYLDLRQPEGPAVYAPESQNPSSTGEGGFAAIVTRSDLPLGDLTGVIQREVAEIDPRLRVNAIVPLKAHVLDGLARERILAWLSGFFGALAVVLAAVGIYGVVSYIVTGRRKEIGIRLALGSSRSNVVQLVLREVTAILAVGVILGSALSLAASRAAGSLLFGVRPEDPLLYVASAAILLAVAGAAAFAPALRAARTNPSVVIRDE